MCGCKEEFVVLVAKFLKGRNNCGPFILRKRGLPSQIFGQSRRLNFAEQSKNLGGLDTPLCLFKIENSYKISTQPIRLLTQG